MKGKHFFQTIFWSWFLLFTFASSAWAANVTIDPSDYGRGSVQGHYRVEGVTGWVTGVNTVDLPSGSHRLFIGDQFLSFTVDASGNVTSTNAAYTTSGNTLTFNTMDITVDPADYGRGAVQGRYFISGVANYSFLTGVHTFRLVPNHFYRLFVGDQWKTFTIDASGNVLPNASFAASGNTLTFNTVDITVDPADYGLGTVQGGYFISGVANYSFLTGVHTFRLVPNHFYRLFVGDQWKTFTIDASGNVLPNASFAASGNTLTFNTVDITVDPADYGLGTVQGQYWFSRIGNFGNWSTGVQTFRLVPHHHYRLYIGNHWVIVTIDASGNILPTASFTASGSTLTFNTSPIEIDPGLFAGTMTLNSVGIPAQTGLHVYSLVAGHRWQLHANGGSGVFQVLASPCSILPPTGLDFGSEHVDISCTTLEPPDVDEDGIPDDNDNCPNVANTDQVDQDGDGQGNVCDIDLDGDGVENLDDNCSDLANADQADLDGDGVGDACDTDSDGDSVPDTDDNCPFTPNTDQADGDSDGSGNACDPDDDNDGVDDTADNCPNTSNADQADTDGDGEGNACDGDVDGDGVGNEIDACVDTPSGSAITFNGCSASQFVELSCPVDSFPNHGKFVSCVAHTAKELADLGLITNKEKARFVNQAAKK